tara:strand:- start:71 stop:496 length:426 start_codon:yes stop_codon:yes gene_type:complete
MKTFRDIQRTLEENLEFEYIFIDENVDDIMSIKEEEEPPTEEPEEGDEEEKEEPEKAEEEEEPTPVNLMKDVLNISKTREMQNLKLGDGVEVKIDAITADKILDVYGNLNDENRLKFIELLGKEEATHKKALVFVFKQTAD